MKGKQMNKIKDTALYFGCPIKRWKASSQFVKRINKFCDPYIKDARELSRYIKKTLKILACLIILKV